jgi:hypothetical protein
MQATKQTHKDNVERLAGWKKERLMAAWCKVL